MLPNELDFLFEGARYFVRFQRGRVSSVMGWRDLGEGRRSVRYDLWSAKNERPPGPKTKRVIEAAKIERQAEGKRLTEASKARRLRFVNQGDLTNGTF